MKKKIITSHLNLSGVLCPINFVKAKLQLEKMRQGDVLQLILDDGEPMLHVPRALKEEGHKILKVENHTNNSFSLLIQKGGKEDGR